MGRFRRGCSVGVLFLLAVTAHGQYVQQTVSLSKGWNAVFLQVEPDNPGCASVFSGWPVTSVSLKNVSTSAGTFTASPDETPAVVSDFLTWVPGRPDGACALNSMIGGQSYLVFATQSCQRVLSGRPAAPRVSWVPSTNACNLVGFCQDGTAKFGTFLGGSGFDLTQMAIYSVSGTNSTSPTVLPVGGFSGFSTAAIEAGKAYFFRCDKVSSFAGPVKVYPAGTGGICFPTNIAYQTLRLVNEHGAALTVTLSLTNSAPAPSGAQPTLPALQTFDTFSGWQPLTLTNRLQRTLASGEEWSIPFAVDRTGMISGPLYGGVLLCRDDVGGSVAIPVEADYASTDLTHAAWPAGLWVGKASLNKVSMVLADGTVVDGAKAGGTLELRLILHVDVNRRCSLLQRVIVAGPQDTNGTWNASLYIDESKVPANAKAVRISSVAFGLKNDMVRDETYRGESGSGFGKALQFKYVIEADDPVNPFRHAYHPDHDGLKSDFKTKLPSGDDPQNYIGEIKPELFSVSNTVSLIWSDGAAAGGGSAAWNPSEKVTGELDFQVSGIRREGPVLMSGAFELQRISPIGVLSTE